MDLLNGLPSLAREALFLAVFLLVGISVTALIKRAGLVRLAAAAGYTIHGGIVFTLVVALALFTVLIATVGIQQWEYTEPQLGVWIALVLVSGAAAIGFGICAACSWRWDANGITYRDLFKRQTIAWSEISDASAEWHNLWRIRSADGRKIWWSKYVIGWAKINEAVALYRPGLVPFLDHRRCFGT